MSALSVLRCTAYTVMATTALACGEPTGIPEPAGATLDGSASFAGKGGAETAALVKRSKPLKRDIVARATITSRGGVIALADAGLIVRFPAGAVTSDLVVSVTAHRGNDVLYTFEPHGAQFARPISIEQLLSSTKYDKKTHETFPLLHAGYLARGVADVDGSGVGTFAETYSTAFSTRGAAAYVVFQTNHFSGYALASGLIKRLVDE
jgi:hypothetical protein